MARLRETLALIRALPHRALAYARHLQRLAPNAQLSRPKRIAVRNLQALLITARWEVFSRLKLHAQALTYDTLLGLVPLLVVAFAVVEGLGGFENLGERLRDIIVANISGSPELKATVGDYIMRFVDNVRGGALGPIPVILLILSVMSLLGHIESSLNAISDTQVDRPWTLRLLTYWAVLTLLPILIVGSLALTAALEASAFVELIEGLGSVSAWTVRVTPFFVTWLGFAAIYYVVPSQNVRFGAALWGAFIAAVLWTSAKNLYALYARNSFTIRNIYGSLATIPLFVLWIYVSWILVLAGAQLSFALQQARTFWQEDLGERANQAFRERLACRVYLEVVYRFYVGAPLPSVRSTSELLDAPQRLLGQLARQLQHGGFLRVAGSEATLLPARDPESVRVTDIVDYLHAGLGAEPQLRDDDATQLVDRVLQDWHPPSQGQAGPSFRALAMQLARQAPAREHPATASPRDDAAAF